MQFQNHVYCERLRVWPISSVKSCDFERTVRTDDQ